MDDGPAKNTRNGGSTRRVSVCTGEKPPLTFKCEKLKGDTPLNKSDYHPPLSININCNEDSVKLDEQTVQRIKGRARRLSANDLHLTPKCKRTSTKAKLNKNTTGQTSKVTPTESSGINYSPQTLETNLEMAEEEATVLSEVLTKAHNTLNMTSNATEDNEVTFKEKEQQSKDLDTNPKQPDYDNMSNGDMIRLFMETMVHHKNEIKAEIKKGDQNIKPGG